MVGSTSPRMLTITMPYVDAWNVWWSIFGNTPEGFAQEKARVDLAIVAAGRQPGEVSATCAVFVRVPGGTGRQMGHEDGAGVQAIEGSADEIADRLRQFAAAGAQHVQLVVDPITRTSIEFLADVLADLDAR